MYLENLSKNILSILANRGFDTEEKIATQLYMSFKDVCSNRDYLGVKEALDVFQKHIGEEVVVYRDYDCDGICSGTLMLSALNSFGYKAYEYCNDRSVDGYGMCVNGIDAIKTKYPACKLIVTVDNGIMSHKAAEYAKSLGYDLIITDHHETGDTLPVADAVVDLKRKDETASFKELCGTGIAFKVMLSLAERLNKDATVVFDSLDIVALATVADVVPLLNENRTLVKEGTKYIFARKRTFFDIALKELGEPDVYDATTLSFGIAPIINALSRMGKDTSLGVKAFLSTDVNFVTDLVKELIQNNDERKALERHQTIIADNNAVKTPYCFCSYGPYAEGIVGIIAGRMKEKYLTPAFICAANDDGSYKGSARSVDAFNVKEALDALNAKRPDIMKGYGGHAKAAGFSINPGMIDDFVREIGILAEDALKSVDLTAKPEPELDVTPQEFNVELYSEIQSLQPFGEGFPVVNLRLLDSYASCLSMSGGQHAKITTKGGKQVVFWNCPKNIAILKMNAKSFTGRIEQNSWNGRITVQLVGDL